MTLTGPQATERTQLPFLLSEPLLDDLHRVSDLQCVTLTDYSRRAFKIARALGCLSEPGEIEIVSSDLEIPDLETDDMPFVKRLSLNVPISEIAQLKADSMRYKDHARSPKYKTAQYIRRCLRYSNFIHENKLDTHEFLYAGKTIIIA